MQRRRLFTMLSALSLLLFVAAAGMWARSGYHCDRFTVTVAGVERSLYAQSHSLHYAFASDAIVDLWWWMMFGDRPIAIDYALDKLS